MGGQRGSRRNFAPKVEGWQGARRASSAAAPAPHGMTFLAARTKAAARAAPLRTRRGGVGARRRRARPGGAAPRAEESGHSRAALRRRPVAPRWLQRGGGLRAGGGRGRSWEQSGGRGASEPCDREGPGRETRRESAGLPGRPGAGSRPPAPGTGGPNAGGSVWRGAPLPAVPSPSPKGGKSRRGAPRLDLAPLSSIFCLMSPGPIVGEGTRHPGHKFTVMAPPAASQF